MTAPFSPGHRSQPMLARPVGALQPDIARTNAPCSAFHIDTVAGFSIPTWA